MRPESTPAVILRTRDFGESDKIVTLLSARAGKFSGIAKGAKRSQRRFAGALRHARPDDEQVLVHRPRRVREHVQTLRPLAQPLLEADAAVLAQVPTIAQGGNIDDAIKAIDAQVRQQIQ